MKSPTAKPVAMLLAVVISGALVLLAGAPGWAKVVMIGKNNKPVSATLTAGVQVVTLKDGLKYQDLVVGKGRRATRGETVTIQYVGLLANGVGFDASIKHGGSYRFVLGHGKTVKGLDEGIAGMRAGGERKIIVPPALGYGARGLSPSVPPNSTLVYTVDLVAVK